MSRIGRIAVAAALAVVAWSMAGCGSGEQGDGTGESPSTGTADAVEAGGGFVLAGRGFAEGQAIPPRYGYNGGNISPPLHWTGGPADTVEWALIVSDADAMGFTHWLVYGIPASARELPEGRPDGVLQGENSFGGIGWGGPDPPPGETHHYVFTLYALREKLNAAAGLTREQLDAAMAGKVLATATLNGIFGQ